MSAFILGSQEASDDPIPPRHQHLCSLALYFSFQSLHSHHEYSATRSWMIVLMWLSPSPKALRLCCQTIIVQSLWPQKRAGPTSPSGPWRKIPKIISRCPARQQSYCFSTYLMCTSSQDISAWEGFPSLGGPLPSGPSCSVSGSRWYLFSFSHHWHVIAFPLLLSRQTSQPSAWVCSCSVGALMISGASGWSL